MSEQQRNGDGGGSGDSSAPIPIPSLPGDAGFVPQEHYTARELDSIAIRFFKNKNADLSVLACLPPKAKSYIIHTDAFRHYVDALIFDAATGNSRITQSQMRTINYFRRNGEVKAKSKAKAQPSIVEVTSEDNA